MQSTDAPSKEYPLQPLEEDEDDEEDDDDEEGEVVEEEELEAEVAEEQEGGVTAASLHIPVNPGFAACNGRKLSTSSACA